MSFIEPVKNGKTYAPGYFLANNEECTRLTQEISASDDRVVTVGTGKYLPMGVVWPSYDANAVGILYESIDVTAGNMPGSVVMEGTVYENRLAEAADSYSSVSPVGTEDPSEEGWYERSGSSPNYVYTLSTDTEVDDQKTYYQYDGKIISSTVKSALAAVGFKFVTDPVVERPY